MFVFREIRVAGVGMTELLRLSGTAPKLLALDLSVK